MINRSVSKIISGPYATEINRLSGICQDPVGEIHVPGDQIKVTKKELQNPGLAGAVHLFRTSPNIWPLTLCYDSGYDLFHVKLEREGKIRRSLADGAQRLPPQPVLVWTRLRLTRNQIRPPAIAE